MKKYLKGMLTACLFYPFMVSAQSEIDALRYSQYSFGSTARSLSMGGAFGALGADFSTLSFNPAGIGVYRKSEFSVSMGFENTISNSEYLGTESEMGRFNVTMPNLGLVFAIKGKKESPWKQFAFGLGYNRLNGFQSDQYFEGKNTENSLPDSYVEQIQNDGGATPEDLFFYYPFGANLAYQTYLIDPNPIDTLNYISVIPNGGTWQSRSVETRGSMGEFLLSFGGNYDETIFWGVTMGFPSIRYEERVLWEEEDRGNEIVSIDSTRDFKSLRYTSYLKTIGRGIVGKFGIIVKPVEFFRISAAIHTPTYYYMSDGYDSQMSSAFANGETHYYESPLGNYNYSLTTPFRAMAGAAIVFGKSGLLSVDYEYTDYTDARLSASDYSFNQENNAIRKLYNSSVHILRAGAEIKYGDISFRGGAAYYSPAFDNNLDLDKDIDQSSISYTGGIGFRGKKFYTDFGYAFTRSGQFVQQYSLQGETAPGAVVTTTQHRAMITLGFRF